MEITRRELLQLGTAGLASSFLPQVLWGKRNTDSGNDPHFFLMIVIQGGADWSYLLDARPMDMTDKKLIQNYTGEAPDKWEGTNGEFCWVSKASSTSLFEIKNELTVLNGVIVNPNIRGHEQCQTTLYTCETAGGDSILPRLNTVDRITMDYIQTARTPIDARVKNKGQYAGMDRNSARRLTERVRLSNGVNPNSSVNQYILRQMERFEKGGGAFSKGSAMLKNSMAKAPGISERILRVDVGPKNEDYFSDSLKLCTEYFQKGICRSILFPVYHTVDTHRFEGAKNQPEVYGTISAQIKRVIDALKNTAFDSKRNLLDLTTVMITSEFGRTMRQNAVEFLKTGTDHNPLGNSVILAGKGIKKGQVIGQTDFQFAEETLSKVHRQFDPKTELAMGKPIDFSTLKARTDLPEKYLATDYLQYASVINTLYSLFGAPKEYYHPVERGGPIAPVLSGILS